MKAMNLILVYSLKQSRDKKISLSRCFNSCISYKVNCLINMPFEIKIIQKKSGHHFSVAGTQLKEAL